MLNPVLRRASLLLRPVASAGIALAFCGSCLAGGSPTAAPGQAATASRGATSPTAPRAQETSGSIPDACALLSSAAIQKVQSEPVKERKETQAKSNSFVTSECFYALPTFTKSISLSLTLPEDAAAGRDRVRELWASIFHRAAERPPGPSEAERRMPGEEPEGARQPMAVRGLGEEAYWIPSVSGTLYVLKGDALLRISIGGKLDDAARLEKSKALARAALARLR